MRPTTETQYVNGLLFDAANRTIPAVAVEGSMYGAVGSSDEITKLVTLFLPGQVENAIQHGLNPQVYATEVLGLAFAFGNENAGMAFATNFGLSDPSMPATTAGDALFAPLPATAIFGAAETVNTPLQFQDLSLTGRLIMPAMEFLASRMQLRTKSISQLEVPPGVMRSVLRWAITLVRCRGR
jgi:hypothetical protein